MADRKIYFATDIHGSEVCLRKFLNAGKFYGCDTIIMGGDITGKMIVPIVDRGQGLHTATLYGRKLEVTDDGVVKLRKTITDAGYYAYETTPEEAERLNADPDAVTRLFAKLMQETLGRWLELAEDRLAGTGVRCFFAPGNDDPAFVDDILRSSALVINPEETLVDLGDGMTMISVGYSNKTPWDSPRELPEDELAAYIGAQAEALGNTDRVIFNFHVPPRDTPIDQAVLLDPQFRPIMKGGMPVISGVGSTAVRAALEKYQPMLSLHGHIHESRGEARIGRTLAINPGSEYSEGVLRGAIITLSGKKGVRGYQLVAG
ncbi:MAG TPA: metallophosphoesterase [Streptosporangiaceae bacterium]